METLVVLPSGMVLTVVMNEKCAEASQTDEETGLEGSFGMTLSDDFDSRHEK
jgi:hypothetical protein